MDNNVDLVIIGAGPAGLSAACTARACGLDVTVIDEQACPGGQLFRNIERPSTSHIGDSKERATGLELVEKFRKCGAKYYSDTTVWGVERHRVFCTMKGKAETLSATNILVACGAMERPVPFPGWTLPGVMGVGGADILLRDIGKLSSGVTEVVLAGNGPLMLLAACHLIDSGIRISAILDTGDWIQRFKAVALMPGGIMDLPYVKKGIGMLLRIFKENVPIYRNVEKIRAVGTDCVSNVEFFLKGQKKEIATTCILRHEGVIPRTHILGSLKTKLIWDNVQRYWYPETNIFGMTSIPGIYVSGDAAYVHGGDASIFKGHLVGLGVSRHLGVLSDAEFAYKSKGDSKRLKTLYAARAFLRYVFAPNPQVYNIPDETIVCRCENTTAGEIRKAIREKFMNADEVKRMTRCGMGQCQGRMCGTVLSELVLEACGLDDPAKGRLKVQQPFRPVTLENYCSLHASHN